MQMKLKPAENKRVTRHANRIATCQGHSKQPWGRHYSRPQCFATRTRLEDARRCSLAFCTPPQEGSHPSAPTHLKNTCYTEKTYHPSSPPTT